jgi:hypothetical protein
VVRRKERSHEGTSVEQGRQKNQTTNNVAALTQKEHEEEKRFWTGPKCKIGIKDPGTKRKPSLKMERISDGFDRKAFGLQFVKQEPEVSSGLLEVKNWALWRTQPPPDWEFRIWILWKDGPHPKRKKNLLVALKYGEPEVWEHRQLGRI